MSYKNFFCSCCVAPKRPLWHLWLSVLHRTTPKGVCSVICTLSQITEVTDLESPVPSLDYKATGRTEEEEDDSEVRERRKRRGALRQVGTWRNVLSGSFSALFVSLCNACGNVSRKSEQLVKYLVVQAKHNSAFDLCIWFFRSLQEYVISSIIS